MRYTSDQSDHCLLFYVFQNLTDAAVLLKSSSASENNHHGDDMTAADTPTHTHLPSVENRQTRCPSIKGTITEVTSMLSSMIDQQKQYFELFATGEEERHRREVELEQERFRLQIELEDRCRQTQMEHDQAMLHMIA